MPIGMALERRAALELRALGRRLEGYAAIFGVETRIGNFSERVAPGAFTATLREADDIVALLDHDVTRLLARTKAGTLKLAEDSRGLHFETTDLPQTTFANDALELVRSGNAGGASFGFRVRKDGESWAGTHRTLTSVDLRDISIVSAFPAYSETVVHARALGMAVPARVSLARRWLSTV